MPEKVEDCVQSALEDNPELSESDAYAICKSQHGEGEAQTLAESEFTRDELDWIADNVDGYAKAETAAGEFWVNGEDGVVVQAEQAVEQEKVKLGNVGGDPFGDEDVLEFFVEDLREKGADRILLGDEPVEDATGIHDRPVVVEGLSENQVWSVWQEYKEEAQGLTGPSSVERKSAVPDEAVWVESPAEVPEDAKRTLTGDEGATYYIPGGSETSEESENTGDEQIFEENPEEVFTELTDSGEDIKEEARQWTGWPTDAEAIWVAAAEITDNQNTDEEWLPAEADQIDADEDLVETYKEYKENLTEKIEEEHGESVTAHRFIHGDVADKLKKGESVQPRTVGSWTTDSGKFDDVIDAVAPPNTQAREDAEDGVIVTMEIPAENVMDSHHANPQLDEAGQSEVIAALDWSDDLSEGDVKEVSEVVEMAESEQKAERIEDYPNILLGYDYEPLGKNSDDPSEKSGEVISQKSFAGPAAPIRSVETKETPGSAASKLNVDELPDEIREAVEADDFIIYGKASIEQYDRDDVPTKLNMDAMADALDRFFGSDDAPGIISLEHQDIPVGRPVREHTLDSDTVIDLPNDGEYEFEAGDTLRTEIREADGDGRPEFWLVARLANDSDIARRTRLRALNGDLDGFSVTFKRNDDEPTSGGREVHELDLHAVTLGTDEQIKNPGSNWDVAEFKAWLPDRLDFDSAIDAMAEVVQDMTDDKNKSVKESIRDKLGVGQKADDDEVDESIEQKTEEIADQIGAKQSTVQEAVNEIADEAGVPTEDILDILEPVLEGEMGEEDVENDGDYEDDEDDEPDDGEMKAGIDEEEIDETVEEKLDEKLDNVATLDEVEEKLDEHQEQVAEAVGEELDEVMQKARTGETPPPGSNEEDTTAKVGDIVKESGN